MDKGFLRPVLVAVSRFCARGRETEDYSGGESRIETRDREEEIEPRSRMADRRRIEN